jgi:hypothetical protein
MKSIIFHLIGSNALFMFYFLNICTVAFFFFFFPLVITFSFLFALTIYVVSLVYSICTAFNDISITSKKEMFYFLNMDKDIFNGEKKINK